MHKYRQFVVTAVIGLLCVKVYTLHFISCNTYIPLQNNIVKIIMNTNNEYSCIALHSTIRYNGTLGSFSNNQKTVEVQLME